MSSIVGSGGRTSKNGSRGSSAKPGEKRWGGEGVVKRKRKKIETKLQGVVLRIG